MFNKFCNADCYQDECVFKNGLIDTCAEAVKLKSQGLNENSCDYYVSQDFLDAIENRYNEKIKINNDWDNRILALEEEKYQQCEEYRLCNPEEINSNVEKEKEITHEYSGLHRRSSML